MSERRLPNEARGEHVIEIGGSEFIVRYPLGAIKKLEKLFDGKAEERLNAGNVSDLVTLIHVGLEYGNNPMSMEDLEREMDLPHVAHYQEVLEVAMGGKALAAKARRDAKAAMEDLKKEKATDA